MRKLSKQFRIRLKKFWWDMVNFPVSVAFRVRGIFGFPSWERGERIGSEWTIVDDENFDDTDNWRILNQNDWGSARPDNLCVYVPTNVICENSIVSLQTIKETATGKGWEGEEITRDYTSGWIETKYRLPMEGVSMFRSKFRCQRDLGSWKAYWLFKNYGKRYQEIDGFEIFAHSEKNLSQWSSTVHWGPSGDNRTMYGHHVKLNTSDWIIMDIIVDQNRKRVKVKINGVLAYVTGIGVPEACDEMIAIFSDSASLHGGKVTIEQVEANLPYLMQIDYFRSYIKA
jgi:hypothetical protein